MKFKSSFIFASAAIALLALVACSGCKKKLTDPFPATGAIAGWEKTS